MVPVRVLVDVDLRQTLRLTRREKKARLFVPREAKGSLEQFLDHVYQVRCDSICRKTLMLCPHIIRPPPTLQAFPVQGMPHNLVVKIRAAGTPSAAQEKEEEADMGEDAFITLRTDADLQRAFATAEAAEQLVQVCS